MKSHLSCYHHNAPDPPASNSTVDAVGHGGGCSSDCPIQEEHEEILQDQDELNLQSSDQSPEHNNAKTHAALLLLTLKEKHRLTQTSVDFAVQQIQDMVTYATNDIKTSAIGVKIPDLTECFLDEDPFSGLKTEQLQTQFYKENFNLIVSGCPFIY